MLRLIGTLKNPLQRSLSRLDSKKYSTASTVLEKAEQFKDGDRLHGYTVKKVTAIPDFSMVAVQLKHDNTGAEHFHLARDDQNNVFSVTFRTTPMDSTGVPHILEHTTLCGSKKYPVRDPFFKMLNRSLSTFMNAWTASDFTMYPFSTQNGKDFSNLMSVYLDAAFFPNLKEVDFKQEGWRLENEKCDDPNSPIIFKGVVFNEMKGALSNAESWYGTRQQSLLLPSHTYGNISGGDPLVIPELTWNQLKEFHATHYHPSNSKFYTYGDLPLEPHLEAINNGALKYFERIDTNTDIVSEPRWTQPRDSAISCAPDPIAPDPKKQTTISVSCMLGSSLDPFESFVMGMLSSLIVAGPNSPFYQALIEPNIGSGYSPVLGIDASTKDATFAIGLQGIHKEDISKVVEIIQSTLEKIHSEGFEQDRIESILHRIELSLKHQTSNFGLGIASALMSSWNHGADPVEMLKINERVDQFRIIMEENPDFLKNKVKEYLIDNSHRLTLVMNPEENFLIDNASKEAKLLLEKVSKLTDYDKEEIFKKGVELEKQQNEIQDISCLPRMYVKDIDKKIKEVHPFTEYSDDVPVQFCEQPTNGITYFRAISDASVLPVTLKPYLPLFCYVATKMGAAGKNYKELAQEMEMYTGGLSLSTHLVPHHTEPDQFELGVMFSSHCLDKNLARMFSLWQDIFNEPTFHDQDRLRTMVNSLAADLAMSIADSGHGYAMTAAASSLTPSARFGEIFGGLSQVMFMKEIAEKEDLQPVLDNLIQIVYYLFNSNDLRCSLNMTADTVNSASQALNGFVSSINSLVVDEDEIYKMPSFQSKHKKTFVPMPFPVNYVSHAIRAIPYNHEDHAKLQILARLLSAKYLHREIREKGGAYGSGAILGGNIFKFFSYRDPNTSKTLKAFEDSVIWATNGSFTEDDIEEAKLSVFSAVDSPVSPAAKGVSLFTQNITNEMIQLHRDRLFDVSRNNIIDVAERYLSPGKQIDAQAIIGPENKLHNKESNWTVRKEFLSAST